MDLTQNKCASGQCDPCSIPLTPHASSTTKPVDASAVKDAEAIRNSRV